MSENGNDGIDLSHVIEIPGAAMFEKTVNNWTKRELASFWADIKRHLTTAAEPFCRKRMGERYYSVEALGGGICIWILSSGATVLLLSLFHFVGIKVAPYLFCTTMLTGMLLVVGASIFGFESINEAVHCRNEGHPYHSRSCGAPRWGAFTPLIMIGVSILLLWTNPVAGVAFIAALFFSAKRAAEQQAAILSRYLDTVDQKIENEHLEAALLGEFPVEETFLHQALPFNIKPELRKNIAAAAVGKPVSIVAQSPKTSQPAAEPTAGKPPVG